VAFVGSRKKADALRQRLAERGVALERLARLKAPAGLDLGAITPDEIAVSILAEIIAARRSGQARGTAGSDC
jgi:xanthine dehydrogenase accessory factor